MRRPEKSYCDICDNERECVRLNDTTEICSDCLKEALELLEDEKRK